MAAVTPLHGWQGWCPALEFENCSIFHAVRPEGANRPGGQYAGSRGRFVLPQSDLLQWHDLQHVARNGLTSRQHPWRQFDHSVGAPCGGDAPRPDGFKGLDHPPIARDEGDVYCKSHEERVHRIRRRDDHCRSVRKRVVVKQTGPPALRVEGWCQPARQDAAIAAVSERVSSLGVPQKRPQEGDAHSSPAGQNSTLSRKYVIDTKDGSSQRSSRRRTQCFGTRPQTLEFRPAP